VGLEWVWGLLRQVSPLLHKTTLTTGAIGSGERCELPQRGSEQSADRPKVSTIFSTQDDLSWHYNIVNCGLSRSLWRARSPWPPWEQDNWHFQ